MEQEDEHDLVYPDFLLESRRMVQQYGYEWLYKRRKHLENRNDPFVPDEPEIGDE